MKISVIIPLYNKSYAIERCLKSILNQTVLPYEVVIVNDGSTDDSLVKSQYFIDSNDCKSINFIIKDQVNQGVSASRNNGIEIASSDYVALLDADDEWYPEFIEKMTALITLYPLQPLYTCKHAIFDKNVGIFLPAQEFGRDEEFGLIGNYHEKAIKYPLVNSSKAVLNKAHFNSTGGFPVGEKLCEDLYLWSRMSKIGHFGFINYVGCIINQEEDISRSNRSNTLPYIISYYSQYIGDIDLSLKNYLWVIYRNHLRLSILNGNRDEFIRRWKQGRKFFGNNSNFLLIYYFIPASIMRTAKIFKRFVLKKKNDIS